MSRQLSPKVGSFPRLLLDALVAAPGYTLPYAQAIQIMPSEYRSAKRFESLAMKPLSTTWMMAACEGGKIFLLPAADAYIRQCRIDAGVERKAKFVGQVAAPRTVVSSRPLDMAKLMRGGPQRPGMNDLRSAPSLMGGVRVLPGAAK